MGINRLNKQHSTAAHTTAALRDESVPSSDEIYEQKGEPTTSTQEPTLIWRRGRKRRDDGPQVDEVAREKRWHQREGSSTNTRKGRMVRNAHRRTHNRGTLRPSEGRRVKLDVLKRDAGGNDGGKRRNARNPTTDRQQRTRAEAKLRPGETERANNSGGRERRRERVQIHGNRQGKGSGVPSASV